ncbi:DUF1552 domain-containing protein [Luteolibacter algae]|uniref:DUF1552 domain-containing protein n=1 Tax=Luteolibacter algae TaxID=454151 RepID=A0ABW5D4H0_9BACT
MNNRRAFLKGLATTLALPSMQSLGASTAKAAPPTRVAFVYIPNGVNGAEWYPDGTQNISKSLRSLGGLRDHYSVLRHLDHDKAKANGDGAGDHARANATFLTGCQARKTAGSDIRLGESVDQIIARQIGYQTRVPSLELSTDLSRNTGICDSGYSCAYVYNLSWRNHNTPMPAENNPRMVFEKLFGSGNIKQDMTRRAAQKSILDFVSSDAKRLQNRLDAADKAKLDQYMTALREVESRIENAEKFQIKTPDAERPTGIPPTYKEHIRMMYEMMLLGFQTDTTRVASFLLAHDGSGRAFPDLGISSGHHDLSHHKGDAGNLEKIAKIDSFYIEQFAWFLERLKQTPDGEGNLLDNSMILYGGGIADGNRHSHDDLPLLLAGHGGNLRQGRVIHAEAGTPMTNLYLSLVDRMGARADRVGDSNGKFEKIS